MCILLAFPPVLEKALFLRCSSSHTNASDCHEALVFINGCAEGVANRQFRPIGAVTVRGMFEMVD